MKNGEETGNGWEGGASAVPSSGMSIGGSASETKK